jgi:hypothetical protein
MSRRTSGVPFEDLCAGNYLSIGAIGCGWTIPRFAARGAGPDYPLLPEDDSLTERSSRPQPDRALAASWALPRLVQRRRLFPTMY